MLIMGLLLGHLLSSPIGNGLKGYSLSISLLLQRMEIEEYGCTLEQTVSGTNCRCYAHCHKQYQRCFSYQQEPRRQIRVPEPSATVYKYASVTAVALLSMQAVVAPRGRVSKKKRRCGWRKSNIDIAVRKESSYPSKSNRTAVTTLCSG